MSDSQIEHAVTGSTMDWTWLTQRGDVSFVPPVAENALPASVVAEGNPIARMSRSERAILSVLRLWPRGATAGAIADTLGFHRSTALRSLRRARSQGLVVRSEETPPLYGSYRRTVFWRLADASQTAALMPYLPVPTRSTERGFDNCGVPPQFWHIFWSGVDPSCLRLPRDAVMVGCRLMESFDSEARSWVLSRYTRQHLEGCLQTYRDPESEVPTLIRRALESLQ